MMKTIATAMVTGVSLLLSGAVMAATEADSSMTFEALDVDKDGYISVEEAKQSPALESVFTNADADQDKQLTEAEFTGAVTLLGG